MPAQKQHFLLAPCAAVGHYIPFLELARRLLKHGCTVTLFAANDQLDQLRDRSILTPEDEASIQLNEVPYERRSITAARDQGPIDVFRMHDRMLQRHIPITITAITRLIADTRKNGNTINAVILDYYFAPAASACLDHGIPYFVFNTGAPLMALSLLTITEDTLGDENTQKWPTMDNFANKDPLNAVMKDMSLSRKRIISNSRGLILNSFQGLAENLVSTVNQSELLRNVPIFQVGPLFEDPKCTSIAEHELTSQVHNWLERQTEGSVIYIAFGSVATPAKPQLIELAIALLELKRPFVWSLPPHCYADFPQLAAGFPDNQTSGSPFLLLPWSPQRIILAHIATGLFVTHCGWNSTLECLAAGKPTVGWPMFSDQYLNAEWLEGLGTGIMVHGTGMVAERVVPAQEIARTFDRVLAGEGFRAQAELWRQKVAAATKSGGSYLSEFSALLAAAGGPGC